MAPAPASPVSGPGPVAALPSSPMQEDFSEEGGGAGHYYGYQDPRLPFYGAEDPYYRHYGPPYPAQPAYPAQYEAVLPHPHQGEGDKGEVPYAHVRYANSDTVYTV